MIIAPSNRTLVDRIADEISAELYRGRPLDNVKRWQIEEAARKAITLMSEDQQFHGRSPNRAMSRLMSKRA